MTGCVSQKNALIELLTKIVAEDDDLFCCAVN